MAFQISDDDDKDLTDINVVPLVDVMLVLLIIFMVTAPLSIGGIQIALPTSKAKTVAVDEDRIVLTVNRKGQYFFERDLVAAEDLPSKLAAIFEHRANKSLYIRADKGVIYGSVVSAMSAAKLSGVQRISMLTEHEAVKK